jgi:DNA-binding MarR family transcriptional regulator
MQHGPLWIFRQDKIEWRFDLPNSPLGESAKVRELRDIIEALNKVAGDIVAAQTGIFGVEEVAKVVRRVIEARTLRLDIVRRDVLSDPAWDMMLYLFLARLEQREVSVSSLCIAANAAPTTALRYISLLDQENVLKRHGDPSDKRRAFLRMTDACFDKLTNYFEHISTEYVPVV